MNISGSGSINRTQGQCHMGTLGVAPISPPSSSPPGCEVGHLRPLVNFQINKKNPAEILFSSLKRPQRPICFIVGDVLLSQQIVFLDIFQGTIDLLGPGQH